MSGNSDSQDCPRCRGESTLMTYTDWKPFPIAEGKCLRCGFFYAPMTRIMPKKELEELRKDFDYVPARKITVEDTANMNEFDESRGLKERLKNKK